MENILQSLHQLEGVHGAIIVDSSGRLIAHRSHSMYDENLQQQVARVISSAIDSVKLIHEDWDAITAQFSDGKLLIRNLSGGGNSPSYTLALIADARLNPSFAGVAIRVAIGKLKPLLASGTNTATLNASQLTSGVGVAVSAPSPTVLAASAPVAPRPASTGFTQKQPVAEVATSGLSWSGFGSSAASGSGVEVADPASSAVLTSCTKALARHVGPMAKLFVKEAVKKLFQGRPFSKNDAVTLVAEIAKHIDDANDAAQFQKTLLKSL